MANPELTSAFQSLGFDTANADLLNAEVLKELSTEALKKLLLNALAGQDESPVSQKVKFLKAQLLPIFEELSQRNPTPDVEKQIPLVQGLWHSVWSTIPFQDILPGRVCEQSYQIFANNGLYANMARYRPGNQQPWLNGISKWLLSYDLMILQTYAVDEQAQVVEVVSGAKADASVQGQWIIENVGIRQKLRFGPTPLDETAAIAWFQLAVDQYQQSKAAQIIPAKGVSRAMAKKYQKVAEAKPQLEHLYIDHDFRLVKTIREKTQRPSYTVAVRLNGGC